MANTPYLGGQQQQPPMHPHHHHALMAEEQRFLQQQYPPHPRAFPQQQQLQQQPYHHRRSSSNAHLAALPPNPVRHPSLPADHPMYHQQQQQQQSYPHDPLGVPAPGYPQDGGVPPPPHPYYQQPHPMQPLQPYAPHPHHHRSNSSSFSAPYPPPPYPHENALPPSPRSIQSAPDQHSPRMDASRQPSMVPHPHAHPSRHYKTPSRSIDAQDLMIPPPPPPAAARMSPGPPLPPQPMQSSQQQQPYNPAEQEMWMERERLRHQSIQPPQFQPDPRKGYTHEREYDRERSEHERMWSREHQMQQQHGGPAPPLPQQPPHSQTAMQVPPPQEGMAQTHGRPLYLPPQQQQQQQNLVHPSAEMQPTLHPSSSSVNTPLHPPSLPPSQDRNSGVPTAVTAPVPPPSSMPAPAPPKKHARQASTSSTRGFTDLPQQQQPHKSVLGKRSMEQMGPLDAPTQLAPNMRTPASPPTTPPAPRFLSPDNDMGAAPLLQGAEHSQPPSSQRQALNRRSAEWMPPPAPIAVPGSTPTNLNMNQQASPTSSSQMGAVLPPERLKGEPGSNISVAAAVATTPIAAEGGDPAPLTSTAALTPPSPPTIDAPDMSKPLPVSGKGTFVCTECSKAYKTQTALLKHQWEHNPHWSVVDGDPDMNKHQQIQLMEAAQILLDMRTGRPSC
ncbi:hypothetical protein BGW42_007650 [Actinomortierella wolfii]|nr:hypothetical protein BGW42_007650 [Actinomortierella wolfii]